MPFSAKLRWSMLNCFNSSRVGLELFPHIKKAKIGSSFFFFFKKKERKKKMNNLAFTSCIFLHVAYLAPAETRLGLCPPTLAPFPPFKSTPTSVGESQITA